MREQSLNAFINRKMFSLFIIMVLVVLSIVYFLTDAFLERVVDNHVHDVTFNIIFSSLKQISNSDDIFRELASIQENFPFIRQISVYSSPELTGNTLFNLPAGRDRDIFGTLTELDSSYRMKLDSYSFAYYLRWDNQGGSGEPVYYFKVLIDFTDTLSTLRNTVNLVISLIIILAFVAIFLVNKSLSRNLITPFVVLAENMSNLVSRNEDLSTIDEKLERTDIREINMLLASYQEMTAELGDSFQQLKKVNEELEKSYQETSVLAENLNNLINVVTRLTDNVFYNKESFLTELFRVAKKLIPEADYGTVFVVENDGIKWLDAFGHDIEEIRQILFDLDYYRSLDEVAYIKMQGKEEDREVYEKLVQGSTERKRPVGSCLTVKLFNGPELAGAINYDIALDSKKDFSRQSIETIKAFGNLASAFLTMQSYNNIHEKFQLEIILAIINILEIHDSYTRGHSENVARISSLLAKEMGYSNAEIRNIEWAGLVHDIGKILISKRILNKKGVLTAEEYEEIKKHSIWGYEVLVNSEELKEVALYVRHHHERWDGKGYPDSLQGQQIPEVARIIALADSWDTMRSDRVYRMKLSREIAIQELIDNRGKQFDPEIVDTALKLIEKGILQ
ncbi:MAG TPA: HD-GYP domain-containing protein [Halanaerobiales bacterium]|nr:HD-GYP domain-containing protein [Halanaerobiales bacterium]HPZ63424.1 HD-GYP domain-containing protein [Halanaerobiales bacterium]HQD04589.1 HD-GYP domain-containing protein [Halanaerobiales bacterium]